MALWDKKDEPKTYTPTPPPVVQPVQSTPLNMKPNWENFSFRDLKLFATEIEAELDKRRTVEKEKVITQMKALAESVGMEISDFMEKKSKVKRGKAPVKYKDGDNEWSGRGKPPKWMKAHLDAGRNKEDYAV